MFDKGRSVVEEEPVSCGGLKGDVWPDNGVSVEDDEDSCFLLILELGVTESMAGAAPGTSSLRSSTVVVAFWPVDFFSSAVETT